MVPYPFRSTGEGQSTGARERERERALEREGALELGARRRGREGRRSRMRTEVEVT